MSPALPGETVRLRMKLTASGDSAESAKKQNWAGGLRCGRGGFDAGAGERIFDSMFTTKGGGMGMGLSISRSIITAHGGRIWASPGDSVGAIFRIVLPSKRSAEGEQVR
jgi:light-regulated signal transduction histidine kinase (bacteriophytochrome)